MADRPATRGAVDEPWTPRPSRLAKSSTGGQGADAVAGAGGDGPGDRVLGGVLERAGQPAAPGRRSSPSAATTSIRVIRPVVTVPVLSSTTVSTSRVDSSTSGPLIRMPSWAPRPVPTISAVGVARPRAQGQAMIRTATAAVKAAAGPPPVPSQNPRVADGEGDHDGHEDAGDPVGQALDLGLAVLGVLDQPRHLGELGVGADPGGADDQPAAGVDGGADDGVAGADLDRHGLAGEHRGVDGGGALARRRRRWRSSRRAGPRTGRRPRAGRSGCAPRRSIRVAQHGDVLGAELEQGPQGGAGAALGPGLEVAAGEDERGDAGGGLEVDVAGAVGPGDGELERVRHARHRRRCRRTARTATSPNAASVPERDRACPWWRCRGAGWSRRRGGTARRPRPRPARPGSATATASR